MVAPNSSPARARPGTKLRRLRVFALTAVGAAFLASAASWLGNTGVTTPNISPPSGSTASGNMVEVTPVTPQTVTRAVGQATVQAGIELAQLQIIPADTNFVKISVAWTDALAAGRTLLNPHTGIAVGLYEPISSGACTTPSPISLQPQYVTITDATGASYCGELDQSSTGSSTVAGPGTASSGTLWLTTTMQGGYLMPNLTVPSGITTLPVCSTTPQWCVPTSLTVSPVSPAVLYVVASLTTPGGVPPGSQPQLAGLSFFISGIPA